MQKSLLKKSVIALLGLSLAGCATTYRPTQEISPRTISARINDHTTEQYILKGLNYTAGLHQNSYRVAVNSFNGIVLLTGEIPDESTRHNIAQMAANAPHAVQIYNYLKISDPKSHSHTVHESYLKSKITAKLLMQITKIPPNQYEIVVRDDIAYVLGVVTYPQFMAIQHSITSTSGILGMTSLVTVLATQDENKLLAH